MKKGGYLVEKARSGGFTIGGFSAELRETFSKRREEIERVADVAKTRDQDALQAIALRTRAKKAQIRPEELKERWLTESEQHLSQIRQIISESKLTDQVPGMAASLALSLSEEHVFERHSAVDERILLREALIAGRGDVTLDELRSALGSRLQSGELVQTERMIASREMLAIEKSVIEWAGQGKGSFPRMGNFTPQDFLSPEQNRAAEKLLGSQDRAIVLIGDAGTGKSTTLAFVVQGIHETGNLTFACAPSSGATQELKDKLKIQADTVQQLLMNEKLQAQVAGRVNIVDGAGLLSIRKMQALCQVSERQKCRLLLVGDVKQHHSVEAGDALRALQKYTDIETVRLKEIHRQKKEEYRKVVQLLARGKAYAAFGQLDRLGGVREQRDWNRLLNQAAATYVDKVQTGHSCLAISPVWSEVNAFTSVLRDRLKEQGFLGKEERTFQAVQSMQWTCSEKMQLSNYQLGDVLTFQRDVEGFFKHELVTVIARDTTGLTVERSDGSQTIFIPKQHGHFDVGLSRDLLGQMSLWPS